MWCEAWVVGWWGAATIRFCQLPNMHFTTTNKKGTYMNVWLDDERKEPEGWLRVKTVEHLWHLMTSSDEVINLLSLDNDLGEGNTEGYVFLDMLEKALITNFDLFVGVVPKYISIHSMNPEAKNRMFKTLEKIYTLRDYHEQL